MEHVDAPVVKQIGKLKKAARKLTGYPLKYAFYGENVPDYINANTTYEITWSPA